MSKKIEKTIQEMKMSFTINFKKKQKDLEIIMNEYVYKKLHSDIHEELELETFDKIIELVSPNFYNKIKQLDLLEEAKCLNKAI